MSQLRFMVAVATLSFLPLVLSLIMGIRFNMTSSMPIGLYQKSASSVLSRGAYVSVCLPKPISEAGLHRGYLLPGSCPNHAEPVLKEIIGVPGDSVSVTQRFTVINHQRYATPIQNVDRAGHSVARLLLSGHFLLKKTYWLYGVNNAKESWDSRYYGSVNAHAIQGVYQPVWVIHKKTA